MSDRDLWRATIYAQLSGTYSSRDINLAEEIQRTRRGLDYIIKITAMNRVSIPYN